MHHGSLQASKYYLGSIGHSIQHLPKWYQVLAGSGIFFVIYLRNNPVISWLVMCLHSSFGTAFVWYKDYQEELEQMSFNERLCFTLYGVTLGFAAFMLYKIFCKETYRVGTAALQMFPDRKVYTAFTVALLCIAEVFRLREMIAQAIGDERSLANIAVHDYVGLEEAGFDPRLAGSNKHFIVQMELLRGFIFHVSVRRAPIVVIACVYRISRDMPHKAHAALRWYFATCCVVSSLHELTAMYVTSRLGSITSWGALVFTAIYVGTLNYVYGPAKRAGMVITTTASNSVVEAVRASITCMALWCITSLLVLTVIVSVHVVELIVLWMMISLLILWVPTTVDSCSTDYITMLSTVFSYIAYAMHYVSVRGAVRLWLLWCAWWLALSLAYNVSTNLAKNRYAGITVGVWFFFRLIAPTRDTIAMASAASSHPSVKEGIQNVVESVVDQVSTAAAAAASAVQTTVNLSSKSDPPAATAAPAAVVAVSQTVADEVTQNATNLLHGRLEWLCRVSDYDRPVDVTGYYQFSLNAKTAHLRGHAGKAIYRTTLQTAVFLCATLTLVNHFIAKRQTSEIRAMLRRQAIVTATPNFLARKSVQTIVLIMCAGGFVLSTELFHHYMLPHIVQYLPIFVSRGISVCVGCSTLGVLIDVRDSMYNAIMRILGLLDPPILTEGAPSLLPKSKNSEDDFDMDDKASSEDG